MLVPNVQCMTGLATEVANPGKHRPIRNRKRKAPATIREIVETVSFTFAQRFARKVIGLFKADRRKAVAFVRREHSFP